MIRQEGSFGGVNEFFIKSVIKSQFLRIRYRKAIHLHKERKLIIKGCLVWNGQQMLMLILS